MNNKKEIEIAIKDFLLSKPEINFAYIFGSFTNREKYHDIDIAIYLNEYFNKNSYSEFPYGYESRLIGELSLIIRKKIDIIVMNNAGLLIQQRIINKNILLFCRDDRYRIGYENNIRKQFIDAAHLRDIKRYYLKKAINNAGY